MPGPGFVTGPIGETMNPHPRALRWLSLLALVSCLWVGEASAGTLIDVGLGRTPADAVPEILAARDRTRAGRTAPARGLTLVRVAY